MRQPFTTCGPWPGVRLTSWSFSECREYKLRNGFHPISLLISLSVLLALCPGLDPARPLIRNNLKARLDPGDATLVQVLHTSSVFGDPKRMGTVDVCVNGGRSQPFCASAANDQLCSHIRSVCFLAQSLFHHKAQVATPCSRRCSNYGGRVRQPLTRNENSIVIGQFMPENAEGTYCISDPNPPYCSMQGDGNHGSPFCCVPYSHDGALNEISNGFTDQ
uniref:Phospholipase A1 n=1 Tax=Cacopsylla melanoneura TaxID=428564 RepID=A0A8D9AVX3_9HEMI